MPCVKLSQRMMSMGVSKEQMQASLVAGVLVVIAAISVLLQQPLLVPSLASAVFR